MVRSVAPRNVGVMLVLSAYLGCVDSVVATRACAQGVHGGGFEDIKSTPNILSSSAWKMSTVYAGTKVRARLR